MRSATSMKRRAVVAPRRLVDVASPEPIADSLPPVAEAVESLPVSAWSGLLPTVSEPEEVAAPAYGVFVRRDRPAADLSDGVVEVPMDEMVTRDYAIDPPLASNES